MWRACAGLRLRAPVLMVLAESLRPCAEMLKALMTGAIWFLAAASSKAIKKWSHS